MQHYVPKRQSPKNGTDEGALPDASSQVLVAILPAIRGLRSSIDVAGTGFVRFGDLCYLGKLCAAAKVNQRSQKQTEPYVREQFPPPSQLLPLSFASNGPATAWTQPSDPT